MRVRFSGPGRPKDLDVRGLGRPGTWTSERPGSPKDLDVQGPGRPGTWMSERPGCLRTWTSRGLCVRDLSVRKLYVRDLNVREGLREAPPKENLCSFGHCPFGGGGLNPCQDGLWHLFLGEMSMYKRAFA